MTAPKRTPRMPDGCTCNPGAPALSRCSGRGLICAGAIDANVRRIVEAAKDAARPSRVGKRVRK